MAREDAQGRTVPLRIPSRAAPLWTTSAGRWPASAMRSRPVAGSRSATTTEARSSGRRCPTSSFSRPSGPPASTPGAGTPAARGAAAPSPGRRRARDRPRRRRRGDPAVGQPEHVVPVAADPPPSPAVAGRQPDAGQGRQLLQQQVRASAVGHLVRPARPQQHVGEVAAQPAGASSSAGCHGAVEPHGLGHRAKDSRGRGDRRRPRTTSLWGSPPQSTSRTRSGRNHTTYWSSPTPSTTTAPRPILPVLEGGVHGGERAVARTRGSSAATTAAKRLEGARRRRQRPATGAHHDAGGARQGTGRRPARPAPTARRPARRGVEA